MQANYLQFERRVTQAATWASCVMMAVASALAIFQVLTRFVFQQPTEWTEVLIRLTLIWMVFLGAPICFRTGMMMSVDVLHRYASKRWKRVLEWIIFLASTALCLAIIYWGTEYAYRARVQRMPGIESISMIWAYSAVPVGGVFCIFALIGQLLQPAEGSLEDTA